MFYKAWQLLSLEIDKSKKDTANEWVILFPAGDWAQAAAWPRLRTWTQAAKALDDLSPGYLAWRDVCAELGLSGPGFEERLEGFDAYLDTVEEIFEDWKAGRGF